jgi:hypothetical protein
METQQPRAEAQTYRAREVPPRLGVAGSGFEVRRVDRHRSGTGSVGRVAPSSSASHATAHECGDEHDDRAQNDPYRGACPGDPLDDGLVPTSNDLPWSFEEICQPPDDSLQRAGNARFLELILLEDRPRDAPGFVGADLTVYEPGGDGVRPGGGGR